MVYRSSSLPIHALTRKKRYRRNRIDLRERRRYPLDWVDFVCPPVFDLVIIVKKLPDAYVIGFPPSRPITQRHFFLHRTIAEICVRTVLRPFLSHAYDLLTFRLNTRCTLATFIKFTTISAIPRFFPLHVFIYKYIRSI